MERFCKAVIEKIIFTVHVRNTGVTRSDTDVLFLWWLLLLRAVVVVFMAVSVSMCSMTTITLSMVVTAAIVTSTVLVLVAMVAVAMVALSAPRLVCADPTGLALATAAFVAVAPFARIAAEVCPPAFPSWRKFVSLFASNLDSTIRIALSVFARLP